MTNTLKANFTWIDKKTLLSWLTNRNCPSIIRESVVSLIIDFIKDFPLIYEELEKRKLEIFIKSGSEWQLLCNKIAMSLYSKVLLDTLHETMLTNGLRPDIIIDDGSIKRDKDGKISYANFIIEVKRSYFDVEDINKYIAYCEKLSIWVLEGVDISASDHKKEYENLQKTIIELERRQGDAIITELRVNINDLKSQLKNLESYLKVDIISVETLISNLKNRGRENLIDKIESFKVESNKLRQEIINKQKEELMRFSSDDWKNILEKKTTNRNKELDVKDLIERAIKENNIVTIRYNSPSEGVTSRDIDPYKINKSSRGQVYILAYCHLKNSIVTLRADRIEDVLLKKEKFTFPKNIDINAPIESFFNKGERT